MWPKYLPLAMFACNTFNIPNLGNFSPHKLTYGRKLTPSLNLDSNPDIKVSGTYRQYYESLNKRLKYLHDIFLNFKSKRLDMINKDRTFSQYKDGDLVHIISLLQVSCAQHCTK